MLKTLEMKSQCGFKMFLAWSQEVFMCLKDALVVCWVSWV